MWFLHTNEKYSLRSVSHSPRRSLRAYTQLNTVKEEEEEGKWTDRTCSVNVVTNARMIDSERDREGEREMDLDTTRENKNTEVTYFYLLGGCRFRCWDKYTKNSQINCFGDCFFSLSFSPAMSPAFSSSVCAVFFLFDSRLFTISNSKKKKKKKKAKTINE